MILEIISDDWIDQHISHLKETEGENIANFLKNNDKDDKDVAKFFESTRCVLNYYKGNTVWFSDEEPQIIIFTESSLVLLTILTNIAHISSQEFPYKHIITVQTTCREPGSSFGVSVATSLTSTYVSHAQWELLSILLDELRRRTK